MLRVVNLSHGQDLAGIGYRYHAASERVDLGVRIRAVRRSETYLRYPYDRDWRRHAAEVARLIREANVLHHNEAVPRVFVARNKHRLPGIVEFHGSRFRAAPRIGMRLAARFRLPVGVSTLDLTAYAPDDLYWLPAPYDLAALARIREEYRRKPDGKVRIVSAPTNRIVKSTDLLEAAVADLRSEGLAVELVVVERTDWTRCLRRKATADIYFDQVVLGYGCNAIEAWGMGIPVVAGAAPYTLDRYRREFGALPFVEATATTIVETLRRLVLSADLRAEYGAIGRRYAERFHAESPALERALDLYQRALARSRPR